MSLDVAGLLVLCLNHRSFYALQLLFLTSGDPTYHFALSCAGVDLVRTRRRVLMLAGKLLLQGWICEGGEEHFVLQTTEASHFLFLDFLSLFGFLLSCCFFLLLKRSLLVLQVLLMLHMHVLHEGRARSLHRGFLSYGRIWDVRGQQQGFSEVNDSAGLDSCFSLS